MRLLGRQWLECFHHGHVGYRQYRGVLRDGAVGERRDAGLDERRLVGGRGRGDRIVLAVHLVHDRPGPTLRRARGDPRLDGFLTIEIEGEILESGGVVALRRIENYTLPSGGIEIRGCSFVEVENGLVTRWADYKSMETIDAIVG